MENRCMTQPRIRVARLALLAAALVLVACGNGAESQDDDLFHPPGRWPPQVQDVTDAGRGDFEGTEDVAATDLPWPDGEAADLPLSDLLPDGASPEDLHLPDGLPDGAAEDVAATDLGPVDLTGPDTEVADAGSEGDADSIPDLEEEDTDEPPPDPCEGGCDDGIGCTVDSCQPGVGCLHQPDDGACNDGDICSLDVCEVGIGCTTDGTEPGPCSWKGQWAFAAQNPVLTPTASDPDQGLDNIYAPDILEVNGQWWMYYGGQGSDGHDAVFLAFSDDLISWQKHPSNANPQPVVDHGSANHVNDPSVVFVNGTYYMYYTEAPTGENDRVHLATSNDGLNWTKKGKVLDVGAPGSWEPDRVGRPSVLYEQGEFRMWYDGQIYGVARHVGYATSPDGYNWTKYAGNPIVQHQGAIDVDRVGDWYVMLVEAGNGTGYFVAKDPVSWHSLGLLWGKSGQSWDQYGQVTPFLLTQGGGATAILFGGASHSCWCKNRIAIAFPTSCEPSCAGKVCGSDGCGGSCGGCPQGKTCQGGACVDGPADCSGCLVGFPTCAAACQAMGAKTGTCGNPGSTNPDQCCACEAWDNCEGCLAGYADCNDACHHAGKPSGVCAEPTSTDPGKCCACAPDTGCEGCLGNHPTCMAACKAAGMNGGWCAQPGSQNPGACCACF
jgi:hypothetical protein